MNEVFLSVKLTPKATRNEISGWTENENGEKYLKASVTQAPEKGKANKALIALLAKRYKLPKSAFEIILGETSRFKKVKICSERIKNTDLYRL
jgi:hypothetical protein